MKITVKIDGVEVPIATPFEGADHALADVPCPRCGAPAPTGVQGKSRRIADDDRAYEADGYTTCCKKPLGLIRAETSTLFGVREDEAVLVHGRPRVY